MDVQVSRGPDDPAWDAFLEKTPRSHYLQSGLWAAAQARWGWRCVRLTVQDGGQIVAGFQMLLRSFPVLGSIGYIPRGPAWATPDIELRDLVLRQIREVARRERAWLLKVQPAYGDEDFGEYLLKAGFRVSSAHADNVATILVDLTQDEETLLMNMKKSLRHDIRRAARKGAVVRQGTAEDLPLFYHILQQTSQRGEFAIHPEAYYREVWERFAPRDHATLLVVECEGDPVAAVMLLGFGETAFARFGGWDGRHSECVPNALLRWSAIQWAKARGYHWYDFMGIDESIARRLLQGDTAVVPEEVGGYTAFKLGFGGQIVVSPGTYDHVRSPLLAGGYFWLQAHRPLYMRVLNLVRGARVKAGE